MADRAGVQKDVARVFARLLPEFGDRIDHGTILRVTNEEVSLFSGAKVRDFVPMIAWRIARLRLREGLDGSDRGQSSRAS